MKEISPVTVLCLLLFLVCCSALEGNYTGNISLESDEKRLFRHLMRNYEKSVRPVMHSSTAVQVKLGITLTQIFDFDERNQVLTVNVWLDQEWRDEHLAWDPDQYGGITTLRIPCDYLWLPDIVLYNSVDDYTTPYMRALAMVSFDGNVFWPPIVRFRCSCKVDITYFPFDDQICHMKMGSWAYDGFQVDILNRTSEIDLSNYIDNGEWKLIQIIPIRNVKRYDCCEEPFPDVTFWLHLRRRTTYYTFNVIIPCIILSLLTISSFLLPAASGEKVSLGLTVLLAFSVFMLLIAETMPATSEFVPLIGLYLTVTMAMTSLSVVLSVFVLHVHHRGSRGVRAPLWLRKLALHFAARILCVSVASPDQLDAIEKQRLYGRHHESEIGQCQLNGGHNGYSRKGGGRKSTLRRVGNTHVSGGNAPLQKAPQLFHLQHDCCVQQKCQKSLSYSSTEDSTADEASQLPEVQREVLTHLKDLSKRQHRDDRCEKICREWQEISAVCDRLLFLLFITVTVLSTIGLLILKPMTKDIDLNDYISQRHISG